MRRVFVDEAKDLSKEDMDGLVQMMSKITFWCSTCGTNVVQVQHMSGKTGIMYYQCPKGCEPTRYKSFK